MNEGADTVPAVVLAGGKLPSSFGSIPGVEKRCLLRVGDRTLLSIVLDALVESPIVSRITVIGDVPAPDGVDQLPEGDSFVENLFRGLQMNASVPYTLVATSDMPFVTAGSISAFVSSARALGVDFVYPIVPVELCIRAYPGMRRTSLPIREGRFTGGNMVLVRPGVILQQRHHIESAYALRKKPLRLAMMLGAGVTLAVALSMATGKGLVRLATLEQAASRLLHAQSRALVMPDPSIATDIDKPEDLAAVEQSA